MTLLIDGYNLLHASGILGRGVGPGSLERSCAALLNFLAESLDPRDASNTIVVFDAASGQRGLPRAYEHRGLRVRFSAGHADADELIEELIRADSTPRRLTVVSSDHRLHRAARRRKASAVDSDRWFASVLRSRLGKKPTNEAAKPDGPLSELEVSFWLERFGAEVEKQQRQQGRSDSSNMPQAAADELPEIDNPFPPGYGEDLAEEDV